MALTTSHQEWPKIYGLKNFDPQFMACKFWLTNFSPQISTSPTHLSPNPRHPNSVVSVDPSKSSSKSSLSMAISWLPAPMNSLLWATVMHLSGSHNVPISKILSGQQSRAYNTYTTTSSKMARCEKNLSDTINHDWKNYMTMDHVRKMMLLKIFFSSSIPSFLTPYQPFFPPWSIC